MIDSEKGSKPFLVPLTERTEAILKALSDRQMSTKDALSAMEKLVGEYKQAMREMSAKQMDTQTFSVYWMLKQASVKNPEAVAAQVGNLLKKYPNWKSNTQELRSLKAELYKVFIPAIGMKERMVDIVDRLLRVQGGVA